MAVNWTLPTKLCGRCKRELTLAHFHKATGIKRGQFWCKECKADNSKEHYIKKMNLRRRLREINPQYFKRVYKERVYKPRPPRPPRPPITSKRCYNCKRELSIDNFYTNIKSGYQGQCKECTNNGIKERRLRGLKYSVWTRVRTVKIKKVKIFGTSKRCYNCKQELSLDNFYTHKKHGYQTQCKECTKKGIKEARKRKRGLL